MIEPTTNVKQDAAPKEIVTDPSDIPRKIGVIDDARKILRFDMEPSMSVGMSLFQVGVDALRKDQDRGPMMRGMAEYFQTWATLWRKLEDFRKANDQFDDIHSILDQTYRPNLEKGFSSLQGAVGSFGDAPYKFDMNFFFEPSANAFREGMAEWGRWEQDADRKLESLRRSLSK